METSKQNQVGCDLGVKFGPNYVQCCEKSKETGRGGIRVFFIFYLGITKQEAVVVKPTKWKFMAIIARNAKL